jgi:predicted RNA-binding protein with PUA-like domain
MMGPGSSPPGPTPRAGLDGPSAETQHRALPPRAGQAETVLNAFTRRGPMSYWLFKSEPDVYGYAHLEAEPDRSTGWDGVRNYQARNMLRDDVKRGDLVLFYHSNADPPAIAGVCEVVEPGQPDPTAFDPASDHHDPASDPARPTWFQVRVRAVCPIEPPIGLPRLREIPALANMELLRKGSRLSIQPVRPGEWAILEALMHDRRAPDKVRKTRKKA